MNVDKDFLNKVLKIVTDQGKSISGIQEQVAKLTEANTVKVEEEQEKLKGKTIEEATRGLPSFDYRHQLEAMKNIQITFDEEPRYRDFTASLILAEIDKLLDKYAVNDITLHIHRE